MMISTVYLLKYFFIIMCVFLWIDSSKKSGKIKQIRKKKNKTSYESGISYVYSLFVVIPFSSFFLDVGQQ